MGFRSDRRGEDDDDGKNSDLKSNKTDNKSQGPTQQEQIATLVTQVTNDIARLHSEYTKYFAGAEKKPPRLLRENLDKLIEKIKTLRKSAGLNPGLNLKVQNAVNSYQTYKTLWDKQLVEFEQGKTPRR